MDNLLTREDLDKINLLGSMVIVERYLPPEKVTPDSLIILPRDFMQFKLPGIGMLSVHDNPRLKVLKVGPGEVLDDGSIESMEGVEVGDILIADSHITDERNKIGVSENEEGIYAVHIKLFECAVVETDE